MNDFANDVVAHIYTLKQNMIYIDHCIELTRIFFFSKKENHSSSLRKTIVSTYFRSHTIVDDGGSIAGRMLAFPPVLSLL